MIYKVSHKEKVHLPTSMLLIVQSMTKGVYREEGMQLTMYPTYSSDFVSETGYAKNRIQYTDVNKWAVLFTEL